MGKVIEIPVKQKENEMIPKNSTIMKEEKGIVPGTEKSAAAKD